VAAVRAYFVAGKVATIPSELATMKAPRTCGLLAVNLQ
jgi:hypothetical protein